MFHNVNGQALKVSYLDLCIFICMSALEIKTNPTTEPRYSILESKDWEKEEVEGEKIAEDKMPRSNRKTRIRQHFQQTDKLFSVRQGMFP